MRRSASIQLINLVNLKDNRANHACQIGQPGGTLWGGSLTWTCKEMDAINANRDDGDNINTIIVLAMDPLAGDISVFTHDVDLELYGKYVLTGNSFHVVTRFRGSTGPGCATSSRWCSTSHRCTSAQPATCAKERR